MSVQQLVGIASRLFAIYMLFVASQTFGIVQTMRESYPATPGSLYLIILVPLAVGVFLWSCPMLVAHKLVPREKFNDTIDLPARQLVAAGAAIIGIWAVVNALPHIGVVLTAVLFAGDPYMMRSYFSPDHFIRYAGIALQCAAGLFLVFRSWVVADKILG
jgi:hypothetical protein